MIRFAREVFEQSDGEVTKAYYADLQAKGPIGVIAMNLFRAQKTSTRAKQYRGRRYKSAAYDVKAYSMGELCRVLALHGSGLGIPHGWQCDPNTVFDGQPSWVLYVDLASFGQVSFHSPTRGTGPDYPGQWDKAHASEGRILAFCDHVLIGITESGAPSVDEAAAPAAPPPTASRLRFGDPESIALKHGGRRAR